MSFTRNRHAIRVQRSLNLGRVVFLEQPLSGDVLQPVRSHHVLGFDERVVQRIVVRDGGKGQGWRSEPQRIVQVADTCLNEVDEKVGHHLVTSRANLVVKF